MNKAMILKFCDEAEEEYGMRVRVHFNNKVMNYVPKLAKVCRVLIKDKELFRNIEQRVENGQHPRLNYLQAVGEMVGTVDDSGPCPLINLKADSKGKQEMIADALKTDPPPSA